MYQNILYDYSIKETIGKGTFSKVKLGINKSTGEKVAIKILEKRKIRTKTDQARVERELQILKKINHINIVKIYQTKEDQNNIYIIMEFIDYDLFLHIVNNKRLEEKESALYYFQLITGLEYIHSLNIVHRDLKPENLLLTKKRILKIIDFGLSNFFFGDELLLTPCGSPSYTPPEMIKGLKYNGYAVDIWSTGIILYGMLCGYLPFEERDNKALFKKIVKCKVNYPKYVSNNAQSLLKKILVENPDKRITIKEIKKHPFFLQGKVIFYKRYPELVEKIENPLSSASNYALLSSNNNNNYNTNNSTKSYVNYERITNNYDPNKSSKFNFDLNNKDKPLSVYKSRKHGANYDLLKRILRASRTNSIENDNNNDNNENNENKENIENKENKKNNEYKKKEYKKRIIEGNDRIKKLIESKDHYSPMKLNGNNRERKMYLKEPLYTEKKKGKYKHYRQKFITTKIDSLDDENEKNSINKTSYNNYYSNGTTENNRNRDDESPLNQYIMNSNKKKYNITHQYNTKRNKNYDYSLLKQSFNPGKESSYHHLMDDDKSLKTLNPILYKNNNNNYSSKSKNTKGTQKNNNTTNNNSRFETISEQFNSFYDNCNTIRNNHLLIKSYIMTKSRYEIKRGKRNFAKIFKKKKSPDSPHYSGLSKKIISINNLYNSIQNKLDSYERRNKYDNNNNEPITYLKFQSSMKNIETHKFNPSILKTKLDIKSEEHRRQKKNRIKNEDDNLKSSTSDKPDGLISYKNSKNNSFIDVRNLKKSSSKKIQIDTGNGTCSNILLIPPKLKKSKKNIKDSNRSKRNLISDDKYNIREIIKRRGLNKNINKNSHYKI